MDTNIEKAINYFLNKESMSPKKIRLLLYYSYSWYLVLMNDDINHLNNKLFNEKFKAWIHGPVLDSVYQKYKNYTLHIIHKKEINTNDYNKITSDILNEVWTVYGKYSANQLESIVRQEYPWIAARNTLYNKKENGCSYIDDRIIYRYYKNKK